ncbi:hypothetical protein D9M68_356020 [compost metagenome]
MFKQLMKAAHNALEGMEARRAQLAVLAVALFPVLAHADWYNTLDDYAKQIQAGLYLLAGTIAIGAIVWCGLRWMVARSTGDHSVGFTDYISTIGIAGLVGGSIAAGTYAWQFFGGV